jgi:hypothetical protein
VQRLAGHELERDVGPTFDLADLVDPADIRVVDAGLRAGLAQKSQHQIWIGAADELDRDRAIEPAVARPVDHAHAALAEQLEHLVAVPVRGRTAARR